MVARERKAKENLQEHVSSYRGFRKRDVNRGTIRVYLSGSQTGSSGEGIHEHAQAASGFGERNGGKEGI